MRITNILILDGDYMEKDVRNILGPTIKSYREKMGITQSCLAELLNNQGINMDRTMIVKIENQTRCLYDYEAYEIAKILKISNKDLFENISK